MASKTEKNTNASFFRKRWVKGLLLFFILCLLLVFLFPFGAKYYLTDWMKKNGAENASIERLWFNPFIGRLTLGGVTVESEGATRLKNADMVLDVHLSSLLKKDIRVEHGKYVGLLIDIEQYEDGRWRYGSYTTPGRKKETEIETTEDVASAWGFLADSVELENCNVHLKTPELDFTLFVESAELKRFTTHEGAREGTFTLIGKINGEDIEIVLDTVRVAPDLQIEGNIHIAKFLFADIQKTLENVLPTFGGEAGLKGNIQLKMSKTSGMNVDYDGDILITSPDIGMDGLVTNADNFKWSGKIGFKRPDDGPMHVATDGTLSTEDFTLALSGPSFTNSEGLISLSGKTEIEIDDQIRVENEGNLRIEGLKIDLPELSIGEETLSWSGKMSYSSHHEDLQHHVQSSGSLALGLTEYKTGTVGTLIEAGLENLSWQGDLSYAQHGDGSSSAINVNGTLDGNNITSFLEQQLMSFTQEHFKLSTNSELIFGEKVDIAGSSSVSLDNFQMFTGEEALPMLTLKNLQVDDLKGLGQKHITFEVLNAEALTTKVKGGFPLDITIPKIKINEFATEDMLQLNFAGLWVTQPSIISLVNGDRLLDVETIYADQIAIGEGGEINCEKIDLQRFEFLGADGERYTKPGLTINNTQLSEMSWSKANGFNGKSLEFADLVTTVIRDKEGQINISQRIAEMQLEKETSSDEDATSKEQQSTDQPDGAVDISDTEDQSERADNEASTPVKLDSIVITGESTIRFEDYTLAVPYLADLDVTKFQVGALDSGRPEQQSEIQMEGELDKRAPVRLNGHISPFQKPIAMDFVLSLKNYPLSHLSAYTVQSVGTALASGQLAVQSTMTLTDNTLDMENNVVLKKLTTKKISEELAQELDNQLPIPLDSALSLLRDNKDNIDLDIPLKGPVDDLGVGISDVLVTALSKAIVPAASGYLMYMLGPYGALAYVGMKVGENLLQVDLPPVEFDPGSSELTADHHDYLERIGKILQDRPDPDIQLCPRVGSWELMTEEEIGAVEGGTVALRDENRQALDDLGKARADAVQSYLINAHSIDKDRLLICETEINEEKETIPALILNM
ncbi:MAG: DUF748 domain-containing protein [Desulfobulbaceae bacterium]|nr:MAG: DUF748 domain-containing protein [Desulfobulbaceae bacterium]